MIAPLRDTAQMYVTKAMGNINESLASSAAAGTLTLKYDAATADVAKATKCWLEWKGPKNTVLRSYIMDKNNLKYMKKTDASDMVKKIYTTSVDFSGITPSASQEYFLRITIPQAHNLSSNDFLWFDAVCLVDSTITDAVKLTEALMYSLLGNLSRNKLNADYFKYAFVTNGSDIDVTLATVAGKTRSEFMSAVDTLAGSAVIKGIKITPNEDKLTGEWWKGGFNPIQSFKYDVSVSRLDTGDEVESKWGNTVTGTLPAVAIDQTVAGVTLQNNYETADREWFYLLGNGDSRQNNRLLYRTEGIAQNPTEFATGFDYINIHISQGFDSIAMGKSETDIIIPVKAGVDISDITDAITTITGVELV